jgi:hypothetical protein
MVSGGQGKATARQCEFGLAEVGQSLVCMSHFSVNYTHQSRKATYTGLLMENYGHESLRFCSNGFGGQWWDMILLGKPRPLARSCSGKSCMSPQWLPCFSNGMVMLIRQIGCDETSFIHINHSILITLRHITII